MPKPIKLSESTTERRQVYFQLVGTDGITPATGEAGGQPQRSINGGSWTNSDIGVLVAIGNGRYYATLGVDALAVAGWHIETRYKSANTAECPGDSFYVVNYDPHLGMSGPAIIPIGFSGIPALGETIYIDFVFVGAMGASVAPGTVFLSVFKDAAQHGATVTVITTRSTSHYYRAITLSEENGYEVGKTYTVVVTTTIEGVGCRALVAQFQLRNSSVDDIPADTYALLGAGRVTVRSPVANNNDLELYAGDDYNNSDNRAITFTGTSSNQWPDLTGATLNFYLNDGTSTGTGTVVTPTGTQVFRIEFTAAQTGALPKGRGLDYTIVATLASSSRKVTLVKGKLYVIDSEAS